MKKLALIGVGGHGDAVCPYIDQEQYQLVGYFDDKPLRMHNDLPILGTTSEVVEALDSGRIDAVFIAIGDNTPRKKMYNLIAKDHYEKLINIIAPTATILDENLLLGKGIFIGHEAFVGAKVEVYDNVIINTKSIVEHNSIVKSHCNVAPASVVLGSVVLHEGAYIGASVTIKQLVEIAPWATIGAGAVVVKNIEDNGTYVGVPAKKLIK
ncbi:acetyltransferase [Mollicutes bacterium LVI A0078]|nr:acetyltransferase [Mollicutes bacterium LVI A0075]WOO90070.1 acetyltransferase [Mollicutes bacterium LVI A0078]